MRNAFFSDDVQIVLKANIHHLPISSQDLLSVNNAIHKRCVNTRFVQDGPPTGYSLHTFMN